MVISGMFTTSANGDVGCAKSASEWTGWRCGAIGGVGGRAELPEIKDNLGLGPRIEEVTCVAMGLRKMAGSKYVFDRGGSCWMLLLGSVSLG